MSKRTCKIIRMRTAVENDRRVSGRERRDNCSVGDALRASGGSGARGRIIDTDGAPRPRLTRRTL